MQPDESAELIIGSERERCAELALVLAAQGIDSQVGWNGSAWVLRIPQAALSAARFEIAAYQAESVSRSSGSAPVLSRTGNPWIGVAVYVTILLGMGFLAADMLFGIDWFARGRMDGGRLLNGEWWRPVTALSLHADLPHLLGNIAFGAFFGHTAARYLGSGFGWFVILTSGALGNAVNGLISGAGHRSIGASTAVFAALGLLSAYFWRRGFPANASRRERLAPVIAGIGLLAFTGTGGANTDLGAHLFGFICGFGAGLLVARFGFPARPAGQLIAGIVALSLFVAAWSVAVI